MKNKRHLNSGIIRSDSSNHVIANYPLTEIQQGMLFEILRDEYSDPVYLVQMIFSIQANLNIPLFLKAFNSLLGRHEVLRSAITYNGDSYSQNIFSSNEIPNVFYDYSTLSPENKLKEFKIFLENDLKIPIDLFCPPLMRIAILKFSHNDYRLVWTRHHIILDGASVELLIGELITIYQALLENKKWLLPQPPSYVNTCAVNQYVDSPETESYWQGSLKRYSNAVFLPAILHTNKKTKKVVRQTASLEGEDYHDLVNFADKKSYTISSLLQAAWGIVLSHYNDKPDVVFGAVRAYPKEKVKKCVGLFINTLPVYLNVDPSIKVVEFLQKTLEQTRLVRKYVNTPLNKIRDWCSLSLDSPLYQCIIDYKSHSLNQVINEHENFDCSVSIKLNTPYPMVMEIINDNNSLQMSLHYDNSLFEKTYVNSILLHYKQILKLLLVKTDGILSELSALLESDFEKIIAWNKADVVFPVNKTVHQLFEEQVEKAPFSTALVFENTILTYQMLNQLANKLARYLIDRGVGLETPVAICLKPNFNMIVAVLAVLKAGGAYIPVDPHYPTKRIKYILNDSRPNVVITQSDYTHSLNQIIAEQDNFKPLLINIEQSTWDGYADNNIPISVMPNQAMYIIYTSGSTGNPKGVVVEHCSAVNMALSCIDRLQVTSQSRILQASSFSFDVSVAEWCMALLSGAGLYLIRKDIFSPREIFDALKAYKITTIILASSILEALPKEELVDLKVIAPGGEVCGQSTINFWAAGRLFLNTYGITETTVCSTMANCDAKTTKPSIIGKPLANTKICILNSQLQPVAIGVPGEIYIGGAGVARGYLNNTELTNEKFVFASKELSQKMNIKRLYKTGDLGRWLPSGEIEYLGRLDDQVKNRGFRVELSEIERNLEKHPAVQKASVVVKIIHSNKQLCAYLIGKEPLDIDNVRHFLQEVLPAHMIPARFIELKELPLTPNGKIDKQKLITLVSTDTTLNLEDKSKKESILEDKISQIIQTNLDSKAIARDASFLNLGFNSISLVHLSHQLSSGLGFKVDIVELFTYPTIETLSAYINRHINHKYKTPTKLKTNRIEFSDEQ